MLGKGEAGLVGQFFVLVFEVCVDGAGQIGAVLVAVGDGYGAFGPGI